MCADAVFEPVNWLVVDGDPLPLTPESEVTFYPSCGTSLLATLADLPGDIVVLSDYLPVRYPDLSSRKAFLDNIYTSFERDGIPYEVERAHKNLICLRIRGKVFLLFFEDNNDTLSRIVASGARIATFGSICDGCSEGGNYECVNDTSLYLYRHRRFSYPRPLAGRHGRGLRPCMTDMTVGADMSEE